MNQEQLTQVAIEFKEFEAGVKEQLHSIFKRLDKQDQLLESVHEMSLSVRSMADGLSRVEKSVKNVQNDVDEIKAKPAKRWESVVSSIIGIVVGAVLALVFKEIGLQ